MITTALKETLMKPYVNVYADVLIVGGGSAGTMAAIRAKQMNPAQKVVIFEKSDVKYSGCIARGMDALNIVAIPGTEETPELYVEANRASCQGIMDEPVNYEMARRSWGVMKQLIDWNVCFPVDENGEYDRLQIHNKGKFCVTMKEPELKTILAKKCEEYGVEVWNRVMTLRLLKDGDRVCGVIAMNVRTGEVIVCRAKSVILCSGGTARFGLPSNGYLYGVYDFPGNTGDGYAMAFRAGAELSGFEYTLVYYIVKDINAPLLYITLTRGAHLLNAISQEFQEDHPGIHLMHAEHLAGRGPMRLKLEHLPEEKIKEIEDLLFSTERPVQERFYKDRGVDFRTGEIEMWPTDCYLCGGHGLTGIRINERGESTVPGLYAAGDVSLCARAHLSGAFAYGQITAENATKFAASCPEPQIDDAQVQEFMDDRNARLNQKGTVPIEEFEYKVRRIINDYIRPPKNEYKLDRALWWTKRFREQLRTDVQVSTIHDLMKVYEVENIIQCAEMSALASKERKESRWGLWHMRSDYPNMDNENWMKHIVLTRGKSMEDIIITHAPIIRMNKEAGHAAE